MAKLIQQRSEILLGFKPKLECRNKISSPPLKYSSIHLKTDKLQMEKAKIDELDNLLIYCNKSFNNKK